MSSSLDAGANAKNAEKVEKAECPKSPDKKHVWEKFGTWPSTWHTCKHCKTTTYNK